MKVECNKLRECMRLCLCACGFLIIFGCQTTSSTKGSCLFADLKGGGGACLEERTMDYAWIRFERDQIEFGYIGETNAEFVVQHSACISDSRCEFERIGKGRSGVYYIEAKSDHQVEFGKKDDPTFMPIAFKHDCSGR